MLIDGRSSEEKHRQRDYLEALEEERRKIIVFRRELPLSLDLVDQAIELCKQQLWSEFAAPECSEQTSSDAPPAFEEFIPIKPASDGEETDVEKSDWLRSVQLWNQTPDPPATQVKRNGGNGAFHPFKKEENNRGGMAMVAADETAATASDSSTVEADGGKKENKDKERKARRCWSPELHRIFLQALQQLGGSHVATPKQIRVLMKVEGLTNDEVKSHLQKYRLHTRRSNPTIQSTTTTTTQMPQFMVVGGIWVPPDYATATMASGGEATTVATISTSTCNGIYAPIASHPPVFCNSVSVKPGQQKSSISSNGIRSHSPEASSSSTHTTTTASADY